MSVEETPPVRALLDRVARVLAQVAPDGRLDTRGLSPTSALDGIGIALDSLGLAELAVALEDEFPFTAERAELVRDEIGTLGDLIAFVRARLGAEP